MTGKKLTMIALLIIVLGFWQPQPLSAQQKKFDYSRYSQRKQDYAVPSLFFMTAVMAAIAVAIVLTIWLLKKVGSGKFLPGKEMTLKESLYLGDKTHLHLVLVRGKLLVIGSGPHPITTLLEMTVAEDDVTSPGPRPESPPFHKMLSSLLDGQTEAPKEIRERK